MFKRFFFVLFAIAGSVSVGCMSSVASAALAPKTKIVDGVFDVSRLTADQQLLVEEALACDDFNWTMLKPSLKKKTGRSTIVVEVRDLSDWRAVGLAWQGGLLQIDDDVDSAAWFQQILMHEVGHMVDFYYLAPKRLQREIAKIYGAPWSVMGHDFNAGFTSAFSCFEAGDANGYLDAAKVQTIRALLAGVGLPPAKTR